MRRKHRIFLSYSREDKGAVEHLFERLTKAGFKPWMDSKDILPGQVWARKIEEAIRKADFFLACLSTNSVNRRGFLQREIRIALDMLNELLEEDIYLIPLRLDDCEVPGHLSGLQWVDLFEDDGWTRLNNVLRSSAGAPADKPGTFSRISPNERYSRASINFEPEMICIPSGEFLMGSSTDHLKYLIDEGFEEKWAKWEEPQHEVYISEFFIGRYPVTKAEFQCFMDDTGHEMPRYWSYYQQLDGKEDHPVVFVSWADAMAYCAWLKKKTKKEYRLPTEAEWEKAARGTDGRIYPWGDQWDPNLLNSLESGLGDTSPVGLFSPYGDSPYGASDMSGGVWEWCSDWFDGTLYRQRSSGVVKNPKGPEDGKYRMLRGGAFHRTRHEVRCAIRVRRELNLRDHLVGFRVALSR